MLSVIAFGHSQDTACITNAVMQQLQAIINACGGADNLLAHSSDVSSINLEQHFAPTSIIMHAHDCT